MTSDVQSTPISVEALLERIAQLEAQAVTKPARAQSEPRAICKREHSPEFWRVTPKNVRYCTKCYAELRLEQAERKLRAAGRIA